MRRILGISLVVLTCAAPAMAGDFQLFGSYWNTSDADNTFGGGLGFGFPLGASPFSLNVNGTYYKQLTDRPLHNLFEDNTSQGFFQKDSLQVIPVDVTFRYNFPTGGNVQPWIGAGATYFFLDSSRKGVDINDETGWNASAGALFGGQGPGAKFYAEAIYRNTKATVRRTNSDTVSLVDHVNLNLDGLGANAGFVWRW